MTAKHHPYDTNTADASSHSPRYRAMPDSNTTGNNEDILSDYHTWSSNQLGVFFRKRGLSEYYDTLQKHKITGQLAPLLNDDDLKQMGIDIVGDRLMFKHHLKDLSRRERYNKRIESFWEGEERIFFSDCDKTCFTCNGFCPVDPSTCKLNSRTVLLEYQIAFRLMTSLTISYLHIPPAPPFLLLIFCNILYRQIDM